MVTVTLMRVMGVTCSISSVSYVEEDHEQNFAGTKMNSLASTS
uniref:Uncharacterized protein n=1 Tax=Arundo donax TaxID=35708 RepID=A0A0A9BKK2_ARUDO